MITKIQPAERLSLVSEYYFSRKLKEVAQMNAEGKDIISLAIGSPDMPPSEQTINRLCEVAHQPNAHGYQPTMGTPELREAMAGFYKRWYGVGLDAKTEILPLIASGMTSPQIADKLFLSLSTIKWHRKRLLEKFDSANTAELISKAKEKGFI